MHMGINYGDAPTCGQCGSKMFRIEEGYMSELCGGWMCEKCGDYVSDISLLDNEEFEDNYSETYDPSDDY